MQTQLIKRAPQARCYKCGAVKVASLCHHCGRPICNTHGPAVTNSGGKLLSMEFSGLGLNDTKCGEKPIHCEHCAHTIYNQSALPFVVGVLIALTGLLLLINDNPRLGLTLVWIGACMAAYGAYINRQRLEEILRSRPPLPLLLRFDKIQLWENLEGQITLDIDGRYNVLTSPVEGTLEITASLGKPERDRLQQYCKKYQLTDRNDISFHGGFVMLNGPVGIRFIDNNVWSKHSNAVVPLINQVKTQPFLREAQSRGTGEWHITQRYTLSEVSDTTILPIWLTPSMVQEAGQRALELELQWTELNPDSVESTVSRIESLELHVPVAWGKVESLTDSAVVGTALEAGSNNHTVRTITWGRLSLTDEERKDRRRTFFIRFENSIDLLSTIRGQVQLSYKSTLSGVKSIDLYYPLGGHREEEPVDIKTLVIANFELSLAGLRYQDIRIVPDPKNNNDKGKQETVTYEGVIPDHNTIIALTNTMSDQGFYVKRVIENPPRTGGRANVVNRFWDIAGRRYLGVYPIDFHLTMTGEEVYSGDIRAQAGTTRATLTVQGEFANSDMEAQIENVWEQLNDLINEVLKQMPKTMPMTALETTYQPEPTVVIDKAVADQSERSITLRKRLDQLMEALIAGRLSEKLFLELKANIEEEIRNLQVKI